VTHKTLTTQFTSHYLHIIPDVPQMSYHLFTS